MPLIFILIIALVIFIAVTKKKGVTEAKQKSEEYWNREREANFVRGKDISNLNYIQIPYSELPFSENPSSPELRSVERQLKKLDGQLIIDLSTFTNTDLKLEYGAPNFNKLSIADHNYTVLVRSLDKWAHLLIEENQTEAAEKVLEYAIDCKTVISTTYKALAELYAASDRSDKITGLMEKASELDSPTKGSLLEALRTLQNN